MYYSQLSFLAFLVVSGVLYFAVPKKIKWCVLLLASMAFYIINSRMLTFFILISSVIIYLSGIGIEKINKKFSAAKEGLERTEIKVLKNKFRSRKRVVLTVCVVLNLGFLLVIKYSPFFVSTFNFISSAFGANPFNLPKFVMPLGISYYTLTGISYMADTYSGVSKAERNPFKVLLYLVYFPHIVEGPFSKYSDISKTLYSGASFDYTRFLSGLMRILYGLVKKLVIADRLALVVNPVFENYASCSGLQIFIAVIFYTFQIYAEFSGCMDIVCGVSEIFGVELAENFNQPFFSKSIDEFWRRWHITLGVWLKTYVFYPVAFSSKMKKLNANARKKIGPYYGTLIATSIALFCVWFSNGFWHGASWKYVLYGLYYFLLMMIGKIVQPLADKIYTKLKINKESNAYGIFAVLRTDIIVLFGMLLFRAPTLSQAGNMFSSIFTKFFNATGSQGLLSYPNFSYKDLIVVAVGFVLMLGVGLAKEKGINIREKILSKNCVLHMVVILALVFMLVIFAVYGAGTGKSPFIYGQF